MTQQISFFFFKSFLMVTRREKNFNGKWWFKLLRLKILNSILNYHDFCFKSIMSWVCVILISTHEIATETAEYTQSSSRYYICMFPSTRNSIFYFMTLLNHFCSTYPCVTFEIIRFSSAQTVQFSISAFHSYIVNH